MREPKAATPSAETLMRLLRQAARAPSSHNTQPWRFALADGGISLYADRTRSLPENDPHDRELTISCGCALMNLRAAAAHKGLAAECGLLPRPDDPALLATVRIAQGAGASREVASLFEHIAARHTRRDAFQTREAPEALLRKLQDTAETEGAWLRALDPGPRRDEAAALIAEGDAIQWGNPAWRRELAGWLRPRRKGDGLPVPRAVAPLAKFVVRRFNLGGRVAQKDRRFALQAPLLAILGCESDGAAGWLRAGQALQRVLLVACAHGLQAGYLNQAIQVEELRSRLGVLAGGGGFPQLLVRLGFPVKPAPPPPRRPLADFVTSNGESPPVRPV